MVPKLEINRKFKETKDALCFHDYQKIILLIFLYGEIVKDFILVAVAGTILPFKITTTENISNLLVGIFYF